MSRGACPSRRLAIGGQGGALSSTTPELLDRTLIWNQSHLLHALREFEQFYNRHRPHQGIANARPLQPLPVPLVSPGQIASLDIRRRDRLGGVLHEYRQAA